MNIKRVDGKSRIAFKQESQFQKKKMRANALHVIVLRTLTVFSKSTQ